MITSNTVMWRNIAQHCRLGLFQDSDFAEDFEDSKSSSGGILCIFGSRTFVAISWMCKKQACAWMAFPLFLKPTRTGKPTRTRKHTNRDDFELISVITLLQTQIKTIIKGRSPTMRHVSRTHRVALDWFFDRINLYPQIQIKYVDTKNQCHP